MDGSFNFQTPGMKRIMLDKANVLQTDTIMGCVRYEKVPLANVTCTCTFSNQLNCFVPILVVFLFGMTADNYERYFLSLLGCVKFSNFDDFKIIGLAIFATSQMLKEWVSIKSFPHQSSWIESGKFLIHMWSSFSKFSWIRCTES